MAQFELHKKTLDELGAQLIYIAAEKRHGLWRPAKYLAEHPVSFPFLLDEDRSVTKAYGLYNALDRDAFRIAHAATLVVNRTGLVQYIYVGASQTDRSDLDTLLAVTRQCVEDGTST
jgi:alkyl hydroperoxide reductase subunit AhpC